MDLSMPAGTPAPTPTTAQTLVAEQLTAIEALAVIGRTFAKLPAVNLSVGHLFPNTICIDVHDALSAFEAWRDALCIPVDRVHLRGTGERYIKAETIFHGARVELTGYAQAANEWGGAR